MGLRMEENHSQGTWLDPNERTSDGGQRPLGTSQLPALAWEVHRVLGQTSCL